MTINFFRFLKKHRQLILKGTLEGGRPKVDTFPVPVTPETPCDQTLPFLVKFENSFLLSIQWNEEFNNGIVNITLDEYFNSQWNRTLIVGTVTSTLVTMDEQDGIQGSVENACHDSFYVQRFRAYVDQLPPKKSLLLFSSDTKQISVQERDEILSCSS